MNIIKFKEPIDNLEEMEELGGDSLISGKPSGDLIVRSKPIKHFSAVKRKSHKKIKKQV